jgi:hypothetical protein
VKVSLIDFAVPFALRENFSCKVVDCVKNSVKSLRSERVCREERRELEVERVEGSAANARRSKGFATGRTRRSLNTSSNGPPHHWPVAKRLRRKTAMPLQTDFTPVTLSLLCLFDSD